VSTWYLLLAIVHSNLNYVPHIAQGEEGQRRGGVCRARRGRNNWREKRNDKEKKNTLQLNCNELKITDRHTEGRIAGQGTG
jgi:hypothetical protein